MRTNWDKRGVISSWELGPCKIQLVGVCDDVEGEGGVLDMQVLDESSREIDLNSNSHLLRLSGRK